MANNNSSKQIYTPGMTRRDSLKWMGLMAASVALPGLTACSSEPFLAAGNAAGNNAGHWPEKVLRPITASGYGKDPDLISPPSNPWPRTLSAEELNVVAILSDIIVPAEGEFPSATQVRVPDVIDEWVSAPYASQQRDREQILPLLTWINDEAVLRGSASFSAMSATEQMVIVDDIATLNAATPDAFIRPARAFARLRGLVLAGYFSSPQGTKDIGYKGNVAIAGDYPGPSDEALAHINQVIDELGLSDYRWTDPV